jgi:ABC-2 type transport system ATP-binding protein
VIEIRSLTKTYGGRRVLDDLSFTAPAGEVTGFLGPNGAGKTTTFRCLLGLAEPTSGAALIDGRRYIDLDEPRHHVGAVLESSSFHRARTARNHLRTIARAARTGDARIADLLDLVGLTTAADRRVGTFSLGMRQRLGLAAAMLGDPDVIVLDEPANGLDPAGVSWVRRLLRSWAAEGRTVVVSSHILAEVAHVVDRVVVIDDGRLVTQSGLAELASGRVRVRVDRLAALLSSLDVEGIDYDVLDNGVIAVAGVDAANVKALASHAGAAVLELSQESPADALEAMFLAATTGRGR